MIPASALVDQSTLAALLEHDPLVQDYRAFFSLLDWSVVEQWGNPALVQALLQSTVRALQDEIPGLGDTVTFDVKHIYAWVKENNERASVPERYDKTKRLAGDPDCRLGVKHSTNQQQPDGSTQEKKELLWG